MLLIRFAYRVLVLWWATWGLCMVGIRALMILYALQCEICNSMWLSLCDAPVSVAGPEYEVGTFHFIVHGSHMCL